MTESGLHLWDFVAIGCYFTAVVGIGLYSMFKNKRDTVKGYFLAGRFMTWLPIGASLFASNIGSEHFIGLAGSGAASGIAVGAFELNSCFLLQFLGWVFLPVYISSGVCTLPEYMKKRFGGKRIRVYLAVLSLCLYIFTKISVNLYSGALFIQQAFNWNIYVSVLLLLFITALTTVTGGLAAVIYTDTLQTIVMISGAFLLTVLGFIKVGGYSALYHGYLQAVAPNHPLHNQSYHNNYSLSPNHTIDALMASNVTNVLGMIFDNNSSIKTSILTTPTYYPTISATNFDYSDATSMAKCGQPRPDSWYMLRDPMDQHMPWPGFLFGQTTASVWYWCADQIIVQRTLAAKSLSHAQGSTLLAGFLKILPVFILVLPGMISRVLFTSEVACSDPEVCMRVCQNPLGCSNIAFPKLVLEIMPTGLKGIMMSVMLAALVGELTSIFNSASTLFTMDVYRTFRKNTVTRELMIVGRSFVCVMVVISILWIPIIQSMQGAQLYIYIQSISAYLAPPIAAVYLLAILWTRTNEKGAFSGLMVGLFLGSTRMVCNFIFHEPGCGEEDTRPFFIARIHYMYYAFLIFAATVVVVVVVSLLSEKPAPYQIRNTTYWTRFDEVIEYKCNTLYVEVMDPTPVTKETGNGSNGHVLLPVSAKDSGVSSIEPIDRSDGLLTTSDKGVEMHKEAKKSKAGQLVDWFCGMSSNADNGNENNDDINNNECRQDNLDMLYQTPRDKRILRFFFLLLLITTLSLYTFFSTGSDFGLLRGKEL